MNYTPDPTELSAMLQAQARYAPPGKLDHIFPGLQIYTAQKANGKTLTAPIEASIVEQELHVVQQQGYQGFCLFAYCYLSEEIIQVLQQFSR